MSWREHAPEPGRCWIRWAPKRWPAPPRPCLDLAERRLLWPAEEGGGRAGLGVEPPPRSDLAYLPPVAAQLEGERAAAARALAAAGVPVLEQQVAWPGGRESAAAVTVVDLLATLLAPAPEETFPPPPARRPPGRLWVVVPLLPGILTAPDALDGLLERLAALAPDALVGVEPELAPQDRRRIAAAVGEERFEAVFHGRAPSARALAAAAARWGLNVHAARPAAAALPPRQARNRDLATRLAEAGDLWLRLGRPEPEGQALLAAARHLEATALDLAALAREGNLAVVGWLPPIARALVAEVAAGAEAGLIAELRREWSSPP